MSASFAGSVGVASGELLALPDWSVVSNVVLRARRLASAASPGDVLLDAATASLAGSAASYESLDEAGIFRLAASPLSYPPGRSLGMHRFVNREVERGVLSEAADRAKRTRRAQVVRLIGPAGIGKSRLAQELLQEVQDDFVVATGRCLSYGASTSAFALAGVVRSLVGDDVTSGLATCMADVERGGMIADRVAMAVGATRESPAPPVGSGPGDEIPWAFRRFLERMAADAPLLVQFDDVHWAEPWLLDLIEYLSAFAAGRIVILACARPELLHQRVTWAGPDGPGRLLSAGPLSPHHTRELVSAILSDGTAPLAAVERIVERSQGNPLFAEQVAAFESDRGFSPSAPLPRSLRVLLQARIDDLTAAERDLLARGSVEGVVFHHGALIAQADDATPSGGNEAAMALMRKGFIAPERGDVPGEDAYRFRHVLLRDAAYESLPKARRAQLHARVADWVEANAGAHDVIGHHLRQTWRYAGELGDTSPRRAVGGRAAVHLMAAGRGALARSALPAAASLFEQAGEMLPERSADRVNALLELAVAQLTAGRLESAGRTLDGLEAQARDVGHDLGAAHAALLTVELALSADEDAAIEAIPRLTTAPERVFTARGDELGLCRVHHLRGSHHWFGLRCQSAAAEWELAAAHARTGGHDWMLAMMIGWAVSPLPLGPWPVAEALAHAEQLKEETHASPLWQALTGRAIGLLHALADDHERARTAFAECDAVLAELESIHSAMRSREARAALLEGDPVSAEGILRDAVHRLQAMGERGFSPVVDGLLARALEAQGRDREALQVARRARRLAMPSDLVAKLDWRVACVRILVRRGRLAAATRLAEEGVRLAAVTDSPLFLGEAHLTLGSVLAASGREGQAYQAYANALTQFERKGAAALERVARSALACDLPQRAPQPVSGG
jgi:tetratricopeptide (TPR) repeat protein